MGLNQGIFLAVQKTALNWFSPGKGSWPKSFWNPLSSHLKSHCTVTWTGCMPDCPTVTSVSGKWPRENWHRHGPNWTTGPSIASTSRSWMLFTKTHPFITSGTWWGHSPSTAAAWCFPDTGLSERRLAYVASALRRQRKVDGHLLDALRHPQPRALYAGMTPYASGGHDLLLWHLDRISTIRGKS